MKYYIDSNGGYRAIEPWEAIPAGCTEVTKADIDTETTRRRIALTQVTVQQQKDAIFAQIADLERAEQLPRVTRESIMAFAVMLAASQGVSEATLYATNIAYKKIKDFDLAIAALRDQAALI